MEKVREDKPQWFELNQEELEAKYPHKALRAAELINEMVRRMSEIMEGME
ncbi:MAG: hypothetical protein WBQ94_12165 [Terracidiphilus sp.]